MSSVSVPKKNIPKKNTSRNLVYSYYANFANLHFYWQLNSVIAITFSCIDSIDCSPFSRNPPHHPPAASLIATECTADILWEKGVEREKPIEVGTPPLVIIRATDPLWPYRSFCSSPTSISKWRQTSFSQVSETASKRLRPAQPVQTLRSDWALRTIKISIIVRLPAI